MGRTQGVPQEWGTIETSRPRRTRHTHRVASLAGRSAVGADTGGLIRQIALRSHTPQKATRKVEALAKLPWLALNHDDEKGGAWAGCVACHAYAQERPHKARPSIYADFSIGAAKLLDTKAAALLRHAKTRLHLQAVASVLDVPCGAQVNTTWNVTAPCADARARLGLTRMRVACSWRPFLAGRARWETS